MPVPYRAREQAVLSPSAACSRARYSLDGNKSQLSTSSLIERPNPARKGKFVSSHLTDNQVEAFGRRTLAAVELLRVDEHLAECNSCRQRLATATQHLNFEQTANFVEGRLTGAALQQASDHLANCDLCRLSVDDLQAFSRDIADQFAREVRPVAAVSVWQRINEVFSRRFAGLPISAYATAIMVMLIGGAWWFWPNRTGQQIVVTQPSPTVSPLPEIAPVKLLAQLNDGGGSLALNERGELSGAENLPADFQQLLKQILTDPRLERPAALNGLGSPSAALMGGGGEKAAFAVIEPVAKVLLTNRPTLRWRALAGAASYEVEIFDERFDSVLKSERLTETSWRLPKALARGRVYNWQVRAVKDDQEFKAPQPPAPLARFRVVTNKEAAEIEQARANFASSHLLLGKLYAEAGLLDEAERELRTLEKANPESEIVRRLLGELRRSYR